MVEGRHESLSRGLIYKGFRLNEHTDIVAGAAFEDGDLYSNTLSYCLCLLRAAYVIEVVSPCIVYSSSSAVMVLDVRCCWIRSWMSAMLSHKIRQSSCRMESSFSWYHLSCSSGICRWTGYEIQYKNSEVNMAEK